mmetsp:Transcript_9181/g.33646  ORF Transcript_9181/g.33646 Transcript_9181/m.33646 type:complete len:226 (-) Transcript_9181:126-803(-)
MSWFGLGKKKESSTAESPVKESATPQQTFAESTPPPSTEPRLYNPYAELYGTLPQSSLEQVYELPPTPEYLFTEEAKVQRRSVSENLTFYTGTAWLAGAVVGAGYSVITDFRKSQVAVAEGSGAGGAAAANVGRRFRINQILNSSTGGAKYGSNAMGMIGLLYAVSESGLAYLRGSDDILNSLGAGLVTGGSYRAPGGPRSAVVGGAVGFVAAGAIAGVQSLMKK